MVTRYTFYDVQDGNKLVLVDAPNSEVCAFLGIKSFDYNKYCHDGRLCRGKYKVVKKVDGEEIEDPVMLSDELIEKWEKECEWYRGFEWRKTWSQGVKRLVPGARR